jgi:hypothetical protein
MSGSRNAFPEDTGNSQVGLVSAIQQNLPPSLSMLTESKRFMFSICHVSMASYSSFMEGASKY